MSQIRTLRSLEVVLESFIERVVSLKEDRLQVLGGINRLDDIARGLNHGEDITDRVGSWFAEHNRWLESSTLRPADRNRIGTILGQIRAELRLSEEASPADRKIAAEIDRWTGQKQPKAETPLPQKLVLRRGSEEAERPKSDSISRYADTLKRVTALFTDVSGNKAHIMSALDDALRSAYEQRNRDALLLSAQIIYYLKINGYKVEPFVNRLKRAEHQLRGGSGA